MTAIIPFPRRPIEADDRPVTAADALRLVAAAVDAIEADPAGMPAALSELLPLLGKCARTEADWREDLGLADRLDWPTMMAALIRAILGQQGRAA